MSKIQKALGRFRDDDQKGGGQTQDSIESVHHADKVSSHTGDGHDTRRAMLRRKRYAIPDPAYPDVGPAFKISVDPDRLIEYGLHPPGDDGDQLRQQFRRIKRPILNIAFGEIGADSENSNVIMVASALPKSGKTFCSHNLALSIARERDVGAVLVDADVLKPNVSTAFDVEKRVGLIDYLLDPTITLDDVLIGTDLHDIVIIPAGQQHDEATELLASRRMRRFVHELSERFQTRAIIVDTPPLLITNEAHVLAEHMGQIVLVIEAGESSQDSVMNALQSLNRNKPINALVNKARGSSMRGYGSGYGVSYYGYHSVPTGRQDGD